MPESSKSSLILKTEAKHPQEYNESIQAINYSL